MANTIALSVNADDAEVLSALFEDKAHHSDLVAAEQRKRGNDEAAIRAEVRATMLRTIAQPLFEWHEAAIRAEREEKERERATAKMEEKERAIQIKERAKDEQKETPKKGSFIEEYENRKKSKIKVHEFHAE